jgi:hypothetical protein
VFVEVRYRSRPRNQWHRVDVKFDDPDIEDKSLEVLTRVVSGSDVVHEYHVKNYFIAPVYVVAENTIQGNVKVTYVDNTLTWMPDFPLDQAKGAVAERRKHRGLKGDTDKLECISIEVEAQVKNPYYKNGSGQDTLNV